MMLPFTMLVAMVVVVMMSRTTMAAPSPTPGVLTCSAEGFAKGGYCSCNSGYGYPSGNAFACASETVPTCVSTTPSALNTTNSPAFLPVGSGTSFASDVVTLGIDAPLTTGRENFTVAWYGYQSAACNFPGPNWVQSVSSAGECADVLTATMPWAFLRENCGFGAPVATTIGGVPYLEYSNSLAIAYDEFLPAACDITGAYHLDFDASCQQTLHAACPVSGAAAWVNVTSGVQSSDFCPSLTLQALLVASLAAYTDATYATAQTAAYINGATAYFQADVSSPQATILSSVIVEVDVNNGQGAAPLCSAGTDAQGNPLCAATAYGSANSIAGTGLAFQGNNGGTTDFHFAVSVVGAAVAYGPASPSGAIFSLAAGSQGTFTVSATIVVQYVGNQRRIVRFKEVVERRVSGATRQMDATASIGIASVDNGGNSGGGSTSGSTSSPTKSSSVSVAAVGGIVGAVLGVAVVGVVAARKKKEQKQNKMIFTEMDARVAAAEAARSSSSLI